MVVFPVQISDGEAAVVYKKAWDMTWASFEESLSDWRFYLAVVACIGGLLAFHALVYRLPEWLIPYVLGLILPAIFVVLDVLRQREALRRTEEPRRDDRADV